MLARQSFTLLSSALSDEKEKVPPSTLPSCSLAVWWNRRHKGGGGWYLFLPDKKIATKYLYTDGWKQYTEPV